MKWFPKLWRTIIIWVMLLGGLSSCRDGGYITPPTQKINATLNSVAAESSPHFSHNGRYLTYTSDRNSQRSIFLYDLQRRRLLNLPGLNQPGSMQSQADISADGRYLVYASEQLGKTDIFLYDRQKTRSRNLTKNFLGEVKQPSISGNGRFVTFASNRSGQWDIEIYDLGVGVEPSQPNNIAP